MKEAVLAFLTVLILCLLPVSSHTSLVNMTVNDIELEELRIEMLSLDWDDPSPLSVEYLVEALAQIGIKVDHVPLDDTVMYPRIFEGGRLDGPGGALVNIVRNFKTYDKSRSIRFTPNYIYYDLHSSQDYPWGQCHTYMVNNTLDAALEASRSALNQIDLKSALYDVQKYSAELLPLLPLFLCNDSHIIRKEWIGYIDQPGGFFTEKNKWTMLNMSATTGDNEFQMAYPVGPSHLNPFLYVDQRSSWAAVLYHDTLLALDADYNLTPWVAESWIKSLDGMQVNFTLRTGVKFHDGSTVTPADVKHTIEFTMNATASPRHVAVEKVKNVTIDDQVIVVNLVEPYSWAEYDIGTAIWILPKAVWEGEAFNDPAFDLVANTPDKIGCGPFRYVEGIEETSWSFDKFADYWFTGGPAMPNVTESVPLPYIDYPRIKNVTIYAAGSSASRLLGMQNDLYDTERYESYAIDILDAIIAGTTGYEMLKVINTVSEWEYFFVFNQGVKPLDDVQVRRAIAYAIDRDACVAYARGGFATPIWSVIPEVFYSNWYNPDIEKYPYNINKANQILDAAGYIDVDDDGIRECPGHYTTTEATTTEETTTTTTTTTTTEETTTTTTTTTTTEETTTTTTTTISSNPTISEIIPSGQVLLVALALLVTIPWKRLKKK
ncbi:MAG: ABC transporter substrate-binding protein [Candidatus Hodarchaeales archaeon]|jgi:ABC-type transport system substrate-binding protein